MTTFAIIAAIGLLLIVATIISRKMAWVSGEDAKRLVEEGALLLDVRTPAEYAQTHIDGAINIPVDRLSERLHELGDDPEPVVVYCRSGQRSGRAAKLLANRGFEDVHDMGPMLRWPH